VVQPNYARRLAETRVQLQREQLDGLVVANHHNRRYLTGLPAEDFDIVESAGWALVTPDRHFLVASKAAIIGLESAVESSGAKIIPTDKQDTWQLIAEAAAQEGVRRLGFEGRYLSYERYDRLRWAVRRVGRAGGHRVELVAVSDLIEQVRAPKDAAEVDAIRRAGAAAEAAFEQLLTELRPGMTERAIARRLEALMADQGALRPSFPTIVAAGPNSAQPHAVPGEHTVREGEPLLIDFGVYLDGYCSDCTRTFALGEPEPRLVELYAVVRAAQTAAEEALRAGARRGRDVDAAARQVIKDAGYGEQFLHGVGHGVGLAVHELPALSDPELHRDRRGKELAKVDGLAPGHIVTVEPGVYFADWGGVRLEDMLLITESGAELLNQRNPEQIRVVR
jgi:Xaa-Pro aminopeptidase